MKKNTLIFVLNLSLVPLVQAEELKTQKPNCIIAVNQALLQEDGTATSTDESVSEVFELKRDEDNKDCFFGEKKYTFKNLKKLPKDVSYDTEVTWRRCYDEPYDGGEKKWRSEIGVQLIQRESEKLVKIAGEMYGSVEMLLDNEGRILAPTTAQNLDAQTELRKLKEEGKIQSDLSVYDAVEKGLMKDGTLTWTWFHCSGLISDKP